MWSHNPPTQHLHRLSLINSPSHTHVASKSLHVWADGVARASVVVVGRRLVASCETKEQCPRGASVGRVWCITTAFRRKARGAMSCGVFAVCAAFRRVSERSVFRVVGSHAESGLGVCASSVRSRARPLRCHSTSVVHTHCIPHIVV